MKIFSYVLSTKCGIIISSSDSLSQAGKSISFHFYNYIFKSCCSTLWITLRSKNNVAQIDPWEWYTSQGQLHHSCALEVQALLFSPEKMGLFVHRTCQFLLIPSWSQMSSSKKSSFLRFLHCISFSNAQHLSIPAVAQRMNFSSLHIHLFRLHESCLRVAEYGIIFNHCKIGSSSDSSPRRSQVMCSWWHHKFLNKARSFRSQTLSKVHTFMC